MEQGALQSAWLGRASQVEGLVLARKSVPGCVRRLSYAKGRRRERPNHVRMQVYAVCYDGTMR